MRDESKVLGSIGVCGRNLCCSEFLGEFVPVSIKMAKEQGLSLNPTKISGACGRLMCCLKYEQDTYEELNRITPSVGAIVDTPDGRGTIAYVSLLKGKVSVKLETGDETMLREFDVNDVSVSTPEKTEDNKPTEPVIHTRDTIISDDGEEKAEKPRKNRNRNRRKPQKSKEDTE